MAGDPRDLSERLAAHAAWLRRLAASLTADPAGAEDLVQDTLALAWNHPPEPARPLRPWLRTIVQRVAWKRRRARAPELFGLGTEHADRVPGPGDLAEKLEAEGLLVDELKRLEEPFRSTLLLRFYEGLEPAEIAARTGVPGGTVRWRLSSGLERLRARLDGRTHGDRRAWMALLIPLGRPPAAVAIPAAPAAIVTGTVLMNATAKVLLSCAALAAVAIGLTATGVLPNPLRAPEADAAVSFRPIERPGAEADARPPASVSAAAVSARTEVASAPVEPALAAPEAHAPTLVEARIVDGIGNALSGARLQRLEGQETGLSGPDGRIELELELTGGAQRMTFEIGCPGFECRTEDALVTAGATAHLGRIALAPGGSISGRVRDTHGAPVAGGRIAFEPVDRSRPELEKARFRAPEYRTPETTTAADGSFVLAGLSPGTVRLWAIADGYRPEFTAPVVVRAGQESYGLEIVLADLPPENAIAVLVLDPTGAPVPRAELDFRHRSKETGTSTASQIHCDAQGRYTFLLPSDAHLWVTARDPEEHFAPASASDVLTAGGELVLRLAELRVGTLAVRTARGAPLERFAFEVLSPDLEHTHSRSALGDHPGGRAEVKLPEQPFVLRVEAPLHQRADVGPFAPPAAGEELAVALEPLPGVTGTVEARGAPLAGARIELHELVPDDQLYEKDGYVCWVQDEVLDQSESDGEGAFTLTPRAPGRYLVRAEAQGFAPAESAPFDVGPDLGGPPLALSLGAGGAIEGHVVGRGDPTGVIVGLSRGDGGAQTLRVGPEGTFRFTRLMPGEWRIGRRDREVFPDWTEISTIMGRSPEKEEMESCRVVEGETTFFDLDLGDEASTCTVAGVLSAPGAGHGFVARLQPVSRFFLEAFGPAHPLAGDGSFQVEVPHGGTWLLVVAPLWEEPGEQAIVEPLALEAGETRWEREIRMGTLVVDGLAPESPDVPPLIHLWHGQGELVVVTALRADEHGTCRIHGVPVGPGVFAHYDPSSLDPNDWPVAGRVEVSATGETHVSAP